MPIIQPGALELFVINCKAHGLYNMQPAAGCGTGPGDISGVLGNLRFYQNDIQYVILFVFNAARMRRPPFCINSTIKLYFAVLINTIS